MSIIILRKILLSNYLYIAILLLIIIISIPRLLISSKLYYKGNIKDTFIIKKITIDNLKLTIEVSSKENLIGTYYFKDKKEKTLFEKNYNLGDKILLEGEISLPKENTTKYLFNYQKYLSTKNIYHLIKITNYKKISNNKNIFYFIKQKILNQFNKNPYLNILLLGDKSYIKTEVTKSYQDNGISHLFAVSGMHVTLIANILNKLLNRLSSSKKNLIICIFLLFYLQLVGLQASVIRGVLFYILIIINKEYYFHIKLTNLFILTLSITLLINPKYIYDLGFQYSFSISFVLIYLSEQLTGKFIISLLKVSLISFLVSIPISLYNFHQLNILSIILNLFFVPFITIIIFPVTVVTSIFTFLIPIYNLLTKLLEVISLFSNKITFLTLTFLHLPTIFYIVYIILIILIIYNLKLKKYYPIYLLLILLSIHYLIPNFQNKSYIKILDIGQGDSIIVHSNNETILIDTGGKTIYNETIKTSNNADNTIIPTLKSLGITKLKYLILTHGDSDHLGDALNLLENFKVETIILNPGNINYLEQQIINKYQNIKIINELEQLSVGDIKLIQLNKSYNNENDSSQVYYAKYKEIDMLFTGDASIEVEEDILTNYNLPNIDILKVGHHGSKTSTSKSLLSLNPKISLISVGLNNKFNHPNQIVINNLEEINSKIYQTSIHGTITINLKNMQIEKEYK